MVKKIQQERNMINQSLDNNDKQEYQTPVLFEYGDIASVTQEGLGPFSDGSLGQPSAT
jgi:hypothetical protein